MKVIEINEIEALQILACFGNAVPPDTADDVTSSLIVRLQNSLSYEIAARLGIGSIWDHSYVDIQDLKVRDIEEHF